MYIISVKNPSRISMNLPVITSSNSLRSDFFVVAEFLRRQDLPCTSVKKISNRLHAKRSPSMAGGKRVGPKVKGSQVQEQERGGKAAAIAIGSSTAQLPWPALKRRSAILSRNELRELDLFTVPNFLSIKECEVFIQCAVALGFQHQGSRGPTYGEAYRDNGRVSVHSPSLAGKLWEAGLNSVFNDINVHGRQAVRLNPNIRFYRYTVGQKFGQHIDESVELGEGLATEYTLLIYLSGGEESSTEAKASQEQLVGGETVFYNRRRVVAEVPPVAGMALFHIHGQQCMLHEAKVVAKGVNELHVAGGGRSSTLCQLIDVPTGLRVTKFKVDSISSSDPDSFEQFPKIDFSRFQKLQWQFPAIGIKPESGPF